MQYPFCTRDGENEGNEYVIDMAVAVPGERTHFNYLITLIGFLLHPELLETS